MRVHGLFCVGLLPALQAITVWSGMAFLEASVDTDDSSDDHQDAEYLHKRDEQVG